MPFGCEGLRDGIFIGGCGHSRVSCDACTGKNKTIRHSLILEMPQCETVWMQSRIIEAQAESDIL